jgi:hypothetical protein
MPRVSSGGGTHTHLQSESHGTPDTDAGISSLHHTIGSGANQAAAGNHGHSYEASGAVSTHEGAADPHTGYQRESEKAATNGYASLDGSTKIPIAQVPTGTSSSTVSLGDHTHAGGSTKIFIPLSMAGTLATGVGKARIYMDASYTIASVRASVGTAPTGTSLIVDVNKNGTTIFTTQTNRPTISSYTTALITNMEVTTVAAGDYLTVDIDQVGSTVAGTDLVVLIVLTA